MCSVKIICIPSGPFATNTYILYASDEDVAVIIDPAPGCASSVLSFLLKENKKISAVWLTHSHWDHTAGYRELCQGAVVPLLVHDNDAHNLSNPGSDGVPSCIPLDPIYPTKCLQGEEILSVAHAHWRVLHTPGHSMGSLCFHCQEEQILFTGDTLFKGTYGNVSFPESSPELMNSSLQQLSRLPPSTIIFPGHGSTTILHKELLWMSALGSVQQ